MYKSDVESIICERLGDYGFPRDGRRYPKLYTAYLNVSAVIKLRLNLLRPLRYSVENNIVSIEEVQKVLDIILPAKKGNYGKNSK